MSANDVDAEKVAADAEGLQAAEEALEAAERRLRIYEDVLGTLNDAERQTMKKAARFLEQTHGARHRPHHRRPLPAAQGR